MLRDGGGPARARSGPERREAGAALALAGACGVSVAQPLYDLLARHPALLVAHRLSWLDATVLALLLSVGLPLLLWIAGFAWRRILPKSARWFEAASLGLLLALAPVQALRQWPSGGVGRLALWGVLALLLGLAYVRWIRARRFLALLGLGALVFPILFLTRPAIRGLGSSGESQRLEVEVGRPSPIVVVVFDELPAASLLTLEGSIHAARFPNFARLQQVSTWYSNATTVAHDTGHAVPAILTGRYPDSRARAPDLGNHPENLFSLLEGSFNLNVVESTTALCGALCDGSHEILGWTERWLPALADISAVFAASVLGDAGPVVDAGWTGFWNTSSPPPSGSAAGSVDDHWKQRDPPRLFRRFESGLDEFPERTVHFLHIEVPHTPWQFLPDGKAYLRETSSPRPHGLTQDGLWAGTGWEVVQGLQRHLLQVQYADTLLGRLLDRLERSGRFDESLVVVTADHGYAFTRGDHHRSANSRNVIDLAHVPLLMKLPGQSTGATDARNAQTIDILPTLAAALDLEVPWTVDGVSLLDQRPRSAVKRIYRSWKTGTGDPLTFPMARMVEWKDTVATQASHFPTDDLFLVAPDPADRGLIGRPAEALLARPSTARARVRRLEDFDAVDLRRWFLPSHVIGTLELAEPATAHARLAVVLDGVVRAVTETYGTLPARRVRFTALLDPKLFVDGARQRLDLYLIETAGRTRVLRPIPLTVS